jgi:hypothetical protein
LIHLKQARHLLVTALFLSGIFCMVLYTACNKKKCGGTTCQNGGTCTNDKCVCPAGYFGAGCEKGWTDGAVGTYNCQRSGCVPAVMAGGLWQTTVVKASTNSGFTINVSNFDNNGKTVAATIDSNGNIKITPATGSYGINANGTYENGKIMLRYTTSAVGGSIYSCNMTMEKI